MTLDPKRFIEESLLFSKGQWYGQPFRLLDWQRHVVDGLFEVDPETGLRKHRTAYVSVPRKNGKTELFAAIALYWLFVAGEPGAEIYSVAGDADQAGIAFDAAKRMIEQNPALEGACKLYRRSIVRPDTGAHYKVLSSESAGKHGYSPELVIFDELHVQRDRELWDVMRTGMGAREQPMLAAITTAGIFDKTSIAWEVYDYACKVRDGVVEDPTFFAAIWEADRDEPWDDPKVWAKANPSLGHTVQVRFLEEECRHAKEMPSFQNTFRRLYLNQWTEQVTRWLDMTQWDACEGSVEEAALLGRVCYGGLDLSTKRDITAWVLVFPDDGSYKALCRFWVPDEQITQRSRRDQVDYATWRREGHITATPGNVVDYKAIRQQVNEDAKRFKLQEIAFDPWNATQLATQLGEEDGHVMVEMRQGYRSMNEPSKELEKLVVDGKLEHGGNPVLRWMASNVAIKNDPAGNIKPDKEKSTERIDGIVALVMALGRATVQTERRSVYEDRGIVFI